MEFLRKRTCAATYERTPPASPMREHRETLFLECINMSKSDLLAKIVDKRPLFEWYAEHLFKEFQNAIHGSRKFTKALVEKEMLRLELLNVVEQYENLSDDEVIERPNTPRQWDMI